MTKKRHRYAQRQVIKEEERGEGRRGRGEGKRGRREGRR